MSLKHPNSSSRRAAVQKQAEFSKAIALLIQHSKGRNRQLIQTLATTGCTPSELTSLRKSDFDAKNRTLSFSQTKNGLKRLVSVSSQLTRSLLQQAKGKATNDFLFSTRQSPKLSTRRVEQIVKDCARAAGIPHITPRELRRSYLEQAAKTAKDDEELKNLTGLKSISKSKALSSKEYEKLTSSKLKPREFLLTRLLLQGLKLKEIVELKNAQVTFSTSQTIIRLLNRKVVLPITLTSKQQELLHPHNKSEDAYLFSTRQSPQLSPRRVEQIIKDIGANLGLELTPSALRATGLARNTKKIGLIQASKQAGLKVLPTYTHGLFAEADQKRTKTGKIGRGGENS